jgi:hypothetical protein
MKLSNTTTPLLAACLALALPPLAAADAGPAMGQIRSQMSSGTWRGLTLIESQPKDPAAAPSPAAMAASAAASTTPSTSPSVAASAPAGSKPTALSSLFPAWGEPLSRQPMNAGKRVDSASVGIPLPTAATRSSAAASEPSLRGR